jgi:protein-disulfide isomerase
MDVVAPLSAKSPQHGFPHRGSVFRRGRSIVSAAQVRKKSGNGGFIAAMLGVVAIGGGFIFWKTQQTPAAEPVVMPSVSDTLLAKSARGYTIGSPTATVEIVEFADYECPACGNFATITEPDVRKNLVNTGKARYTFYDFPLTNIHQNTVPASMAAACANDQSKFWEMHDALFAGQFEWNGQATDNPRSVISKYAQTIGLDMPKWNACMDAGTHADRIKANYALGVTKQVASTPTFFVNGVKVVGNANYDDLNASVNAAIAATLPIPAAVPEPVPAPKN